MCIGKMASYTTKFTIHMDTDALKYSFKQE